MLSPLNTGIEMCFNWLHIPLPMVAPSCEFSFAFVDWSGSLYALGISSLLLGFDNSYVEGGNFSFASIGFGTFPPLNSLIDESLEGNDGVFCKKEDRKSFTFATCLSVSSITLSISSSDRSHFFCHLSSRRERLNLPLFGSFPSSFLLFLQGLLE